MNSLEELSFALDIVEAGRPLASVVAAPAGYVPGANPNNLSDAELEQRRAAALKSADARRKSGVTEMMRIRNMAVANVAVHKAQADFFMQQAAENRKAEIRSEIGDPSLSDAERQLLTDELADVYATSQMYNAERAKEAVQRQQKLRYWQKEMADASKRYDSAAWANAKANADALKAEMDDEEIAGAMLKEHNAQYKQYMADQERARKAAEKAEREHQAQLKKFFNELERQRKKAEREAESARKKAEKEAKKKSKDKDKGGGDDMTDYQKSLASEREKILQAYYGNRRPERLTETFANRNKKKKKK